MTIPDKLWTLIGEFLRAKKNGQIILHVNDGNVLKLELRETVKN